MRMPKMNADKKREGTLVMTVSSMMPPFSLVNTLSEPLPLGMPATSPTTRPSKKGTASLPCLWQLELPVSTQLACCRACK